MPVSDAVPCGVRVGLSVVQWKVSLHPKSEKSIYHILTQLFPIAKIGQNNLVWKKEDNVNVSDIAGTNIFVCLLFSLLFKRWYSLRSDRNMWGRLFQEVHYFRHPIDGAKNIWMYRKKKVQELKWPLTECLIHCLDECWICWQFRNPDWWSRCADVSWWRRSVAKRPSSQSTSLTHGLGHPRGTWMDYIILDFFILDTHGRVLLHQFLHGNSSLDWRKSRHALLWPLTKIYFFFYKYFLKSVGKSSALLALPRHWSPWDQRNNLSFVRFLDPSKLSSLVWRLLQLSSYNKQLVGVVQPEQKGVSFLLSLWGLIRTWLGG